MWTDRVRLLDDVAPADWIAPRLSGPMGTVAGTVPAGYPAYARVLHPVVGPDEEPMRWAQVAAFTGRTVHATAQWHALVDAADPWNDYGSWPHGRPDEGDLAIGPLTALCKVLTGHTATPQNCLFALWEGWGVLNGGRSMVHMSDDGRSWSEPMPPMFDPQEWASPRVELPARTYLLLSGPLSAMTDLVHYDGLDVRFTQSPSLFWPVDRAWCVATEIDFDSTLVGGTRAAIDAVLAAPELETWPVRPIDSLMSDADRVNRTST